MKINLDNFTGTLGTRKRTLIMRMFFISFCILISFYTQAQEYSPIDFNFNRIDFAICDGQIKRISYVNDSDTTEYFIEFRHNYLNGKLTETTTGYLKTRIPYGEFRTIDTLGRIIYSLDFDTIPVGYKEIKKIAAEHNLALDTLRVYYGHRTEYTFYEEGHWIIPIEYRSYSFSNSSGVEHFLIDERTGAVDKTTIEILEQPAYLEKDYNEPPKFIGGEQGLKRYLNERSKFQIIHNGRNWVRVNCDITKTGVVRNASIACTNSTFHNTEALRLVNSMPNWIPAIDIDGNRIDVNWEIRINFK